MKRVVIFFVLMAISGASHALTMLTGKVTFIESTFAPTTIFFQMDGGAAPCPAGTNLKWQKTDIENNKAAYALLLAATTSGKTVRFYINDGDSTCTGQFLHLLYN